MMGLYSLTNFGQCEVLGQTLRGDVPCAPGVPAKVVILKDALPAAICKQIVSRCLLVI